ncbi:hypothetical protein FIE12Z_801 [Fusarium flagelliforme]|uniref:Uncharacterized protein n=1 Tax=Fusarium flagelliforme TaxID=2675880 RepID=A0A395N4A2_9HYPO|nr:hypothetical protein FIE12Z_801 [Fusarium flagelliforme]
MAQRKSSTSLAARAYRRSRSGGSSPHNRSSFTVSSASSQESDSPSEYGTPSASRPSTPPTRLPTPSVKSDKGRRYTASSNYPPIYNTGSTISPSDDDDDAGPSENRRDDQDQGKARQIYGDTESLRLSRMEDKLDELLSLEKQKSHEKKLETATEEQMQSSQSYLNLKDENARLQEELEAIRTELTDSQQAQMQTQSSMQDLEAAKERLENEVSERMAQSMNEYETLQAAYEWAKKNWNRTAEESTKAWDKAKEYERKNTILKQKISDLEDVNKELAGGIKAYDLENIKRKESQRDGESQTEPATETEVEPGAESNGMESQGTGTNFIDCDPNAKGEMKLHGQGELESTDIQDGEQVEQDIRQEDQQQGLQDALWHDQHEVPQDKPEVRPEGPQETQQEDTHQEVTQEILQAQPHIQQGGEQEEPETELRDSQDEGRQQDGTTNNLQVDQQESEEEILYNGMLARVERQLERLMSTTQEPVIGGHTEPDNIDRQEMVGTTVSNGQPTVGATEQQETPVQQSLLETQDVALVETATVTGDIDTDTGKGKPETVTETETKDITIGLAIAATEQETRSNEPIEDSKRHRSHTG